ncbi:hypothetical protein EJ04DRAFT_246661 [Polyplosphaeria fusca]|uniref:Uncharacterized protein n=1 Tax=Polyplosphaeria fusca TaxID=682080 RepID=A0A9P4R0F5_9PLEO|nr:hypothetical protein EJ04DRAFT_246661 [Polyplosphaeria fusca]
MQADSLDPKINLYPMKSTDSSAVPALRWLRQEFRAEHPEHGVRLSEYQGRPSNEIASAWRVKEGGYLATLGGCIISCTAWYLCLTAFPASLIPQNQMRNLLNTSTASLLAARIDSY